MKANRSVTVAMVAILLVAAGAPAVAAGASIAADQVGFATDVDEVDQTTLSVTVDQNPATGAVLVTVVTNETGVANATVAVETPGNYTDEGTHVTDANGTVALAAPNETVTATITATAGNRSATETVELVPREESLDVRVDEHRDGTATVSVTQYGEAVANATVVVETPGNYTGEGTYETDANGTVALAAPNGTVTATIAATAGDLSAETTVELGGGSFGEAMNFGQLVSSFVNSLLDDDRKGGIGQIVSEFVREHNPGADKRPEHAGPPGEKQGKNPGEKQGKRPGERPGNVPEGVGAIPEWVADGLGIDQALGNASGNVSVNVNGHAGDQGSGFGKEHLLGQPAGTQPSTNETGDEDHPGRGHGKYRENAR
jgi:hypothetical protein